MFNWEPGPASAAASRNVVRSSSISGEICGSQEAGGGTGTTTAKKLRSNIQRSTEMGVAVEMRSRVPCQGSPESTDGSTNSNSSDGRFIFPTTGLRTESQFSDFLDGLGPAQIVGRQMLAAPPMGDMHIAIMDRSGQLEVEVEARGLTPKPGSTSLPATYIKVYLLESRVSLAKKKTKVTKKTCDPLYQQALLFDEGPQGKVLQVIHGNAGSL
ncbi:LOW QUALITY PROTEIN: regulating synaptic membrane exocytosis protein 3-like [Camelus ferus]|uniref:LOW QUALITY PROTEIN: regulating synaptic membrane exocytosis protein 3-like n=1 Tax=Camelus ferus TaxID=419612 RepID=A0A8B8SGV4_CAMFR|nr:LOW QUALITY PROTEIN: regulating synaptic membrane exocytosis protein 3-like [Camelus ferus]